MTVIDEGIVRVAFLGDVALNGGFERLADQARAGVFRGLASEFQRRRIDFVSFNLESPVDAGAGVNTLKEPRVSTTTRALAALETLRPRLAILANNHVYDCLMPGVAATREWLESRQIASTGIADRGELPHAWRGEINGRRFSVLAYAAHDTHPSLPDDAGIELSMLDESKVLADIRTEADDGRTTIVNLHWGVEFSHFPSPAQRTLARACIDAGAIAVIGHHTHTLQGYERWNGGHIWYGLGNIAFDDVVDARQPVLWTSDQRHGGVALLAFGREGCERADTLVTSLDPSTLAVDVDASRRWAARLARRSRPLRMPDEAYRRFWRRYQIYMSVLRPPFAHFFGERKSTLEQLASLRPSHARKLAGYVRTFRSRVRPTAR